MFTLSGCYVCVSVIAIPTKRCVQGIHNPRGQLPMGLVASLVHCLWYLVSQMQNVVLHFIIFTFYAASFFQMAPPPSDYRPGTHSTDTTERFHQITPKVWFKRWQGLFDEKIYSQVVQFLEPEVWFRSVSIGLSSYLSLSMSVTHSLTTFWNLMLKLDVMTFLKLVEMAWALSAFGNVSSYLHTPSYRTFGQSLQT